MNKKNLISQSLLTCRPYNNLPSLDMFLLYFQMANETTLNQCILSVIYLMLHQYTDMLDDNYQPIYLSC